MPKLRVAALTAGALIPLFAAGVAASAPVATGRTSCGTYSPELQQAEQAQIDDAYAVARARQAYNDSVLNLHGDLRDDSARFAEWQHATAVYNQSKQVTDDAMDAAEKACH